MAGDLSFDVQNYRTRRQDRGCITATNGRTVLVRNFCIPNLFIDLSRIVLFSKELGCSHKLFGEVFSFHANSATSAARGSSNGRVQSRSGRIQGYRAGQTSFTTSSLNVWGDLQAWFIAHLFRYCLSADGSLSGAAHSLLKQKPPVKDFLIFCSYWIWYCLRLCLL